MDDLQVNYTKTEKKYTMEDNYKTLASLSDIKGEFEGYIWMSDETKARIIKGQFVSPKDINPFIVEGYLYSKSENRSISIRHTDKGYHIGEIDLNNLSNIQTSEECIKSHRIDSNPALKFKQAWLAQEDPNCAGMEVLKPIWKAFVGFNK